VPTQAPAKPADPCALVIFGATGDLTKRLVVPALYNLSRSKVLPKQFALIGVARSDGTADSWRERLHDMLKSFVGRAGAEFNTDHIDEDAWARLADAMTYISGDLTKPDLYEEVRAALDEAEKLTARAATPSFISPSLIGYSVPSWINWAKPSSPIRARTRTAAADSGAGW
jgi:Glucose-6-phosphate 1-dehydrogenase